LRIKNRWLANQEKKRTKTDPKTIGPSSKKDESKPNGEVKREREKMVVRGGMTRVMRDKKRTIRERVARELFNGP